MYCNHCGNQIPDGARFCGSCGNEIAVTPIPAAENPAPLKDDLETTRQFELPVDEPVYQTAPASAAVESKKGSKKTLVIVLSILIPLVLVIAGVGIWFGLRQAGLAEDYEAAAAYLEDGKYDKALKAFKKLGDYQDAEKQVKKLEQLQKDYDEALELLENGEHDAALEIFAELDDYRDSEDHVAQLEYLVGQYEQALELMSVGEYENAREILVELGSYRDSHELAQYGIPYEMALRQFNNATTVSDYLDAADVFWRLDGYKDADTWMDASYMMVCQLYLLEHRDVASALHYSYALSDASYEDFLTMLEEHTADNEVLDALKQALIARTDYVDSGSSDYAQMLEIEWVHIAEFEGALYIDPELEQWVSHYIDGIIQQENALQGNTFPADPLGWYRGALVRAEAIEALMDNYGFLSDHIELKNEYDGAVELFTALVDIEILLENQLWNVVPSQDDVYGSYLWLNNYSDYDFTVYYVQSFGNEGEYADQYFENTITIASGETVMVPLVFPENWGYNPWYIDWSIYDVYDGFVKLD